MNKKVFLAAAFLALMAVGAFAQEYNSESDFKVKKNGNGITITKYSGKATVINIPPTIQNLPVISIEDGAFKGGPLGSNITSVTIPDSVTSIGYNAFYLCNKLTSVTFQGTISADNFANWAFFGDLREKYLAGGAGTYTTTTPVRDKSAWRIRTPAAAAATPATPATPAPENLETDFRVSVTQDGKGVIITEYIGTATSVRIPAVVQGIPVRVIGGNAFREKRITRVVIPEGVTTIEDSSGSDNGSFHNCRQLVYVSLPSTLRNIGNNAFRSCTALTSITLPESLTAIGQEAFAYSGLTSITIPNRVTSISEGTFRGCTALTSITLPESLTAIGRRAFSSCTALTSITIPNRVTSIGQEAFAYSGLTSIIWPARVTYIEGGSEYYHGMFAYCKNLQSVTIPEGVTDIGDSTFFNCTALTDIALPSTIRRIGRRAFMSSSLTNITIPDSVKNIDFGFDNNAFSDCSKLNLASQAVLRRVGYTGGFSAFQ